MADEFDAIFNQFFDGPSIDLPTALDSVSPMIVSDDSRLNLDTLMHGINTAYDDVNHSAIEIAMTLLRDGHEVEKVSVLQTLPNIIEIHTQECLTKLLPAVQDTIASHWHSKQVQETASEAYRMILLHRNMFPNSDRNNNRDANIIVINEMVTCLLVNIRRSEDDIMSSMCWLEALAEVLNIIPTDILKDQVVELVNQCAASNMVQRRISAAKIIEKLCARFDSNFLHAECVPTLQLLCQDPSVSVRATVCQKLPTAIKALCPSPKADVFLPNIIELCNDEDATVRDSSYHMLGNVFQFYDTHTLKNTMMPLIKQCVDSKIQNADPSLPAIAQNLIPWCYALKDVLTPKDADWYISTFVQLARWGIPEKVGNVDDDECGDVMRTSCDSIASSVLDSFAVSIRCWCAYNFPAVVLVFGGDKFVNSPLSAAFTTLCTDPHEAILKTIGVGFHEVVNLLEQDDELHCMVGNFCSLVKSGDNEVLNAFAHRFVAILPKLYKSLQAHKPIDGPQATMNAAHQSSLDRIVLACNRLIRNTANWRCHHHFLIAITALCESVHIDKAHMTFAHLLREESQSTNALPCREMAIDGLLTILARTPTNYKRQTLIDFFVQNLAQNQSYRKRMLFLYVCERAIDLFSRQFFVQNFLEHLIKLGENDAVVNVRTRVCRMLPTIKRKLLLPENAVELRQLESIVRKELSTNHNDSTAFKTAQDIALLLSKTDTASIVDNQRNEELYKKECSIFGIVSKVEVTVADGNATTQSLYVTLPQPRRDVGVKQDVAEKSGIMSKSLSDQSSVTATITLPMTQPAPTASNLHLPITCKIQTAPKLAIADVTETSVNKFVTSSIKTVAVNSNEAKKDEKIKTDLYKQSIANAHTPPVMHRQARRLTSTQHAHSTPKLAVVRPQQSQQKIVERTPSPRPGAADIIKHKEAKTTSDDQLMEKTKQDIMTRVENVKRTVAQKYAAISQNKSAAIATTTSSNTRIASSAKRQSYPQQQSNDKCSKNDDEKNEASISKLPPRPYVSFSQRSSSLRNQYRSINDEVNSDVDKEENNNRVQYRLQPSASSSNIPVRSRAYALSRYSSGSSIAKATYEPTSTRRYNISTTYQNISSNQANGYSTLGYTRRPLAGQSTSSGTSYGLVKVNNNEQVHSTMPYWQRLRLDNEK